MYAIEGGKNERVSLYNGFGSFFFNDGGVHSENGKSIHSFVLISAVPRHDQ